MAVLGPSPTAEEQMPSAPLESTSMSIRPLAAPMEQQAAIQELAKQRACESRLLGQEENLVR